jgi:hypothetical protein
MKYLGAHQLAECMRCGQKGLARDLMPDGRNPHLLVFSDCYDPPHPAERPFIPRQNEGKAKYPIAPEVLPVPTSLLEGSLDDAPPAWEDDPLAWQTFPAAWLEGEWSPGGAIRLTWTRFTTVGARFERYEIFRSIDDSPFVLLATNVIEYDFTMKVLNEPEYLDLDLNIEATHRYYVDAVSANGKRARSNTLEIVVGSI